MQTFIGQMEFVELVFGFTNSLLGFVMVVYTAKTLRKSYANDNKKLISYVKTTLLAIIFLSAFSLVHFLREAFHLKDKFGPIVEIPEYIAIFFVFLILLGQIIFFDAPDDFFK